MANLTSVHVTGGIPDGGTGTVSTIDELILVGLPLTGGTVTVSGTVTGVVSGTTFISGGTVTAQISGGTSFISGGNVTAVISGTATLNQAGAAISSTNGIFSNLLLSGTTISTSNALPVVLTSSSLSIGNVTSVINIGGAAVSSTNAFYSNLTQSNATLTATNGIYSNVLLGNAVPSTSNALPVSLLSSALQIGQVTAVINVGGAANSSTNGEFTNLLQNNGTLTPTNGIYANSMFGNTAVSSTNGLPVNLVSGTISIGSIGNTTFFSLQTGTWNNSIIQGGVALSSTNGIYSNILQQNSTLSPTNGIYANVLFNNTLVSASVGLPVNLVTYIPLTAIVSGTTFVSGGNITAVVSGTTALNQGGSALSSTNGIYSNMLLGNAVPSSSNALSVQLLSGSLQIGQVTSIVNIGGAAVSSTNGFFTNLTQNNGTLTSTNGIYANVLFGNSQVTAGNGLPINVVSGTISVGNVTAAINQGGAAVSSTNGAYFNVLFNNALVSASVGLPVNLVTYIGLTAVVSGTTFISGGNLTAALNQGGNALSSTNGGYFNILFNNALVSASVGLPVNLVTYAALTAVVSGTTFISGGNITSALNQGGNAISSTNGIFSNILLGNAAISSTNPLMIEGDTASGVADANNPVKVGGIAKNTNPTAVSDGQRVNALYDVQGRHLITGSIRALKSNFYTSISTTGETVLVPAISTAFVDVYGAIIANKSGSTILMTFKDSTGGNTQFELEVPSFDTRGFMLHESAAFKQAAQNTTWTVTPSLATSISLTLLYMKNTTS